MTTAAPVWRLPPDASKPLYLRIATVLAALAEPEQRLRLPPERDLALLFGVSRITLRKALQILQDDGFVERGTRRGTLLVHPSCRDAGGDKDAMPSVGSGPNASILSA